MSVQGFDAAWSFTGPTEGGYSDDPNDPGRETMYGITLRTARAWGYTGAMKDLSAGAARAIAYQGYWRLIRGDEIWRLHPAAAVELFDIAFNIGMDEAATWLQDALNGLNRDQADYSDIAGPRVIGPLTLSALATLVSIRGDDGREVLMRLLLAQRCCYYMRLRKERYLFGWVLKRGGLPGVTAA